ncbi:hypothetical protein QTP86_030009 [Hemibagrus guttatus]|nr:hypothetical protein QTP86_030009 [Hemibagrus guttatus]
MISRHGVEMDVVKVQAVTEWPAPTSVRELQRFLGFANFYRRFIRNYSSVAAPLTSLLRDPDLPFVVEVDASSSGLGAVLSQRHGKPGKLHPCAFYSRKLTSAEVNYDVGNRELLAIKAALEEWCHWLEGARHPFQVLTDHHNLEYLRGAKNGKADALSRQFEADDEPAQPDVILPATAILAPVQWNLIEEIRQAHTDEPPPAGCPPNPNSLCPYTSDSRLCSGCTRPPAPDTQAFADLPSSSATVLVVLPGFGCGGVCQVVPHVRTGADQSFTSGGAAGTPSGPSTPLDAPVGGLPDRPARLRRFYDSDGGGRSFLEGV